MVQVSGARGWDLQVERGPDWLFVRPRGFSAGEGESPPLAEQIWGLLTQNFAHRLVLELDDVVNVDSHFVGQLIWLAKRIQSHGGIMRVCGLSMAAESVLHACHLDDWLGVYRNREDAVMGKCGPKTPR